MSKFTGFLRKDKEVNTVPIANNGEQNYLEEQSRNPIKFNGNKKSKKLKLLPNGKKPSLISVDEILINACSNVLNDSFGTLVQYSDYAENRQKLMDVLMNDELFSEFPVHNNELLSRSVLNYIVDLGAINILLERHPDITDISYNGSFLTYETSEHKYIYGHQDEENADDFAPEKISRLILKFTTGDGNDSQLSESNPTFNGMYRNLRVSVDHESLTPKGMGGTFSLRVSKASLALNVENFDKFAPVFIYSDVIVPLMLSHANILISGETSTGKTELQKLLVKPIPLDDKVIMIEDTPETHLQDLYPDKDIFNWVTHEVRDEDDPANVNIADHVAMALRNNPKWIMVSETRGAEAYLMFQAVMTGQSLTTTLHSMSNSAVPSRFIGMITSSPKYSPDVKQVRADFLRYMHIGLHITRKKIGGHVYRFLDEMAEFVPESEEYPEGINVLFSQRLEDRNGQAVRHWTTGHPTNKLKDLVLQQIDADFDIPFVDESNDLEKHPNGYEEVISDNKPKEVTSNNDLTVKDSSLGAEFSTNDETTEEDAQRKIKE